MEQISDVLIMTKNILMNIASSEVGIIGIPMIIILLGYLETYREQHSVRHIRPKKSTKSKKAKSETYIEACWDEIQKENGYKK